MCVCARDGGASARRADREIDGSKCKGRHFLLLGWGVGWGVGVGGGGGMTAEKRVVGRLRAGTDLWTGTEVPARGRNGETRGRSAEQLAPSNLAAPCVCVCVCVRARARACVSAKLVTPLEAADSRRLAEGFRPLATEIHNGDTQRRYTTEIHNGDTQRRYTTEIRNGDTRRRYTSENGAEVRNGDTEQCTERRYTTTIRRTA